jgi:hypothetical protein
MFMTINITNAEAFRERAASALEALTGQGVTADDVHAEFLTACKNKLEAQDAWERLHRLDNPTAAELALYAKVLRVNTTWLITGDVRFIPELMAGTCLCWLVPEDLHFIYFGATEPGSAQEHNPDCPVHPLQHPELTVFLGDMQPEPTGDLVADFAETEI